MVSGRYEKCLLYFVIFPSDEPFCYCEIQNILHCANDSFRVQQNNVYTWTRGL